MFSVNAYIFGSKVQNNYGLNRTRQWKSDLVEADNMRVTEQLHYLYFTKDLLEVVYIQLHLVNDLDCHLAQ